LLGHSIPLDGEITMGRRKREDTTRLRELERSTLLSRAAKRNSLWKIVDGLDEIIIEFIKRSSINAPEDIKQKREKFIDTTLSLYKQRLKLVERQIEIIEEIENLKTQSRGLEESEIAETVKYLERMIKENKKG
jgi:anaerobic ribonucleoside-triphosphate reductase